MQSIPQIVINSLNIIKMRINKQTKEIVTDYSIVLNQPEYERLETSYDIVHKLYSKDWGNEQLMFVNDFLSEMLGTKIDRTRPLSNKKESMFELFVNVHDLDSLEVFKSLFRKTFPNKPLNYMVGDVPAEFPIGKFAAKERDTILRELPTCIKITSRHA